MTRISPKHGLVPSLFAFILAISAFSPVAARAHSSSQAAPSQIKAPRLDYKITTLKNGLKVVTLEDHNAPVVTLEIWYHVGSKDEVKGRYGFAHMFEHLMFKGSAHVPPNKFTQYVEQVGGEYNANTSFDRTMYYETVPSNALDRMLYLEADRMASLIVDQTNFVSERHTVEEEYRLRVANAPYGRLFESVQKLVYPDNHPYQHPTIGSIPDLEAATAADVRAFHDVYYKPDDATLVLTGDFDTKTILAKIDKLFGPIPKSKKPFPRLPYPADTQKEARSGTFYDKLAPLPMTGIAYRLPEPKSPDTPVFTVITQILSEGESSRLYRSVVREKQLAVQAGGETLDLRYGGIFFFYAVANAGKDPMEVQKALADEVGRLRDEPVSADELKKARNQALSSLVFGRLTTQAKADALGEADLLYDTPEQANRELAELSRVTAADIQRVARKYFAPVRANTFYMLPGTGEAKPAAAAGEATR